MAAPPPARHVVSEEVSLVAADLTMTGRGDAAASGAAECTFSVRSCLSRFVCVPPHTATQRMDTARPRVEIDGVVYEGWVEDAVGSSVFVGAESGLVAGVANARMVFREANQ